MIIEITTEIIWGTFLDVKHWPEIKNPKKYEGQRVVIGSVTDGYNPQEKEFGNTRKLLEQLRGSGADILITTKSDLVVRELERKAKEMAEEYDCPFVDNEMPYGRVPQGHPVIVDYFYLQKQMNGWNNKGKTA